MTDYLPEMRGEGPVPRHEILPLDHLLRELFTDRTSLLKYLFAVVVAVRYVRPCQESMAQRSVRSEGTSYSWKCTSTSRLGWLFGQDCKDAFRTFLFLLYGSRIATFIKIYRRGRNDAFGPPIMVINSLKAATELLDRRATVYSDRPRMIVANETLSGGLCATFIRFGDLCVIFFSRI
jgi:hypothetical protein